MVVGLFLFCHNHGHHYSNNRGTSMIKFVIILVLFVLLYQYYKRHDRIL